MSLASRVAQILSASLQRQKKYQRCDPIPTAQGVRIEAGLTFLLDLISSSREDYLSSTLHFINKYTIHPIFYRHRLSYACFNLKI